jgi:hypothetical protein
MSLFKRLDDVVVSGANATVRAWNYTTGKTKVDLANLLLSGASVAEGFGLVCSGMAYPVLYFFTLPVLAPLFFFNHRDQIRNTEMTTLEQRTAEQGQKHPLVEGFRSSLPFRGYNDIGWGAAISAFNSPSPSLLHSGAFYTSQGIATGFMLSGASYHIMRAEYLPPRKNMFQRGREKLQATLKKLSEEIPVPTPAGA